MSDDLPYDGILFELWADDVNALGGRRRRLVYAITNEPIDVPASWKPIDQGPHVLAKARELGVGDGDYTMVDA